MDDECHYQTLLSSIERVKQRTSAIGPIYQKEKKRCEKVVKEVKELEERESFIRDQIFAEKNFEINCDKQLNAIDDIVKFSQGILEQCQMRFIDLATKNAILSAKNDESPIINAIDGIGGFTPYLQRARLLSQVVYWRTKYQRKLWKLRKIQNSVFCLNDGDNHSKYHICDGIDTLDDEYFDTIDSILTSRIKEEMSDKCNFPHFHALNEIESALSNDIYQPPKNNNTIKYFQQSAFNSIHGSINYMKEIEQKLNQLLQESSSVNQSQSELVRMRNSIKLTLDNIFRKFDSIIQSPTEYIKEISEKKLYLCSKIINKSHSVIFQSQEIIDCLQNIDKTDNSCIIDNQTRIKVLIESISSDLSVLINNLNLKSVIDTDKPFNNEKNSIIVDEISNAQIVRFNELLQELSKSFEDCNYFHSSIIDRLCDQLEAFKRAVTSSTLSLPNIKVPPPVMLDDSDIRNKMLILRNEILEMQKSSLMRTQDLIINVPSHISSLDIKIDHSGQNSSFSDLIEPYKPFALDNIETPYLCDMFSDSNHVLLERIMTKDVGLKTITTTPPEDNSPISAEIHRMISPWEQKLACSTQDRSKEYENLKKHFLESNTEEINIQARIKKNEYQNSIKKLKNDISKLKNEDNEIKEQLERIKTQHLLKEHELEVLIKNNENDELELQDFQNHRERLEQLQKDVEEKQKMIEALK